MNRRQLWQLWKQSIDAAFEGRAMLWVPGYRPTLLSPRYFP